MRHKSDIVLYNPPQAASALGSPEATASGFFTPVRVSFLVDGFNLYHSLKSAERHLGGPPLRWLDLHGLCRTLVSSALGPAATLVSLATFKRREHYHCLSEFRVRLPLVRRWWRIPVESIRFWHRSHEEKETDVAIACSLLELFARGACDAAVLVSGDTDLAPAIRTARSLYPAAPIIAAFPFDRHNSRLERLATRSVRISAQLYRNHQLPTVIIAKNGRTIVKPARW